jgi:cysteine desulfurase
MPHRTTDNSDVWRQLASARTVRDRVRVPYFDHNATTPLSPIAREAWLRASDESWQNPSSPYRDAARVRARLEQCREQLAQPIGGAADRIVFNSGATEGANAVLAHWAKTLPPGRKIAVNPTEHPCVVEAARHGFAPERLVWLELDGHGVVQLEGLEALLTDGVVGAVSVMAANNETGVVQPWSEISALCRRHRVAYHCDASQWLGKLPSSGLGAAGWVTATAHKFGGPKGVGFLVRPEQAEGFRSQQGGEQERGHRAGTEDFPAIAAMVAALADTEATKVLLETERLCWRDAFVVRVRSAVPGVQVVGAKAERLWNTVSLIMPHAENHRWVVKLDRRGFQVSTGSACSTGRVGPSPVLAAMGLAADEAKRAIRISAGWETTQDEWLQLASALAATDVELRVAASPDVVRV